MRKEDKGGGRRGEDGREEKCGEEAGGRKKREEERGSRGRKREEGRRKREEGEGGRERKEREEERERRGRERIKREEEGEKEGGRRRVYGRKWEGINSEFTVTFPGRVFSTYETDTHTVPHHQQTYNTSVQQTEVIYGMWPCIAHKLNKEQTQTNLSILGVLTPKDCPFHVRIIKHCTTVADHK